MLLGCYRYRIVVHATTCILVELVANIKISRTWEVLKLLLARSRAMKSGWGIHTACPKISRQQPGVLAKNHFEFCTESKPDLCSFFNSNKIFVTERVSSGYVIVECCGSQIKSPVRSAKSSNTRN